MELVTRNKWERALNLDIGIAGERWSFTKWETLECCICFLQSICYLLLAFTTHNVARQLIRHSEFRSCEMLTHALRALPR